MLAIYTMWTVNDVNPYPFNAVKRVWIDPNKKGNGWTETSLTVHTVGYHIFFFFELFYISIISTGFDYS